MSQAKLTLRPPPNIDFVQGYPGIPPGAPDRPQAAVKGAIEVRVGPQGVKARWVRVELRKIETLPGGGLTNTFFDFVGQSPISLWQANEDYGTLSSQDFPFYIRIPESIPPSIALEKGAGVKYELIATLCVKGKKSFLKREKDSILATSTPIIIDKHELHSTWPVYTQPEGRKLTQEGVTLTVERTNTCFGPGDRIAVTSIVRSEGLSTAILRGFEFSLRETIVFRAGPHTTGKKGAPQVKVIDVGEQKVPVNATLYGGTHHTAELSVTVPTHHTTTTLNAARHIDITYVLVVKALMGTGKPLTIDLPVVISNWPRSVSVEAVRRIGIAPNVQSQVPNSQAAPQPPQAALIGKPIVPNPPPPAAVSPIASSGRPHPFASVSDRPVPASNDFSPSPPKFNTAPLGGGAGAGPAGLPAGYKQAIDEFGYNTSPTRSPEATTNPTIGSAPSANANAGRTVAPENPASPASPTSPTTTTGYGARPRTGDRNNNSANRLTVTNFGDDMPEEVAAANARAQQRQLGGRSSLTASTAIHGSGNGRWETAEEEKRRLYDRAKLDVDRVQGGVASPTQADPGRVQGPGGTRWLSAEEEKIHLYNSAQANARRLQQGVDSPAAAGGSSSSSTSAGALMYAQAMSSINRTPTAGNSSITPPPNKTPATFQSAEEEKAALRRYHEAKAAVDRNQFGPSPSETYTDPPPAAPISYEALYGPPPGPAPPANSSMQNGYARPPAFNEARGSSSSSQPVSAFDAISEKERLKRAYEAQDAQAAAAALRMANSAPLNNAPAYYSPPTTQPPPSATPAYSRPMSNHGYSSDPPPPIQSPHTPPQMPLSQGGPLNAFQEKELLRRQYEAQDAAAASPPPPPASAVPAYVPPIAQMASGFGGGPPPSPPERTRGSSGSMRAALPTPRRQPPSPGGSLSQQLTAAEEKARLRAIYEAQDAQGRTPPSMAPSPNAVPSYSPSSTYSNYSSTGPVSPHGMNGSMNGVHRAMSAPSNGAGNGYSPPPLFPRPPREYIEETREADARTAAQIHAMDQGRNGNHLPMPGASSSSSSSLNGGSNGGYPDGGVGVGGGSAPELKISPFTPFAPGYGNMKSPPPPPPFDNGSASSSPRPPLLT